MKLIKIAGFISFILLLILFVVIWIEFYIISLIIFYFVFVGFILLFTKRDNKNILLSFFSFYSFWGLLVTIFLVDNPLIDYYYGYDSITFYEISSGISNANDFNNFFNNFKTYSEKYIDTIGWNFVLGINAFFSKFIDKNNIYVHVLTNSLIGCISTVLFYRLLLNRYPREISLKWTIVFGFFSFIPVFTPTLFRDVIVSLFFLMAYNVVLKNGRFWIFQIVIIALITSFFRPESGIVMLGFLIIIFKRIILWKILVICLSILVFQPFLIQYLERISDVYEVYSSYSQDFADPSGLGAKLFGLPLGLRELAVIIFSQIQPFPSLNVVLDSSNPSSSYFRIYEVIVSMIHVILWSFVLIALFIKKIRIQMPREYLLLLFLTLIFLAATIFTFSHRRAFSIYPGIYLLSIWCFYNLNSKQRLYAISLSIFSIISLNIIYFIIK